MLEATPSAGRVEIGPLEVEVILELTVGVLDVTDTASDADEPTDG